jgi:prepilin-type N-terminal cleavage/methylation domain-containing protein/prepilin-type processing-associated H-X9-DG protein
MMAGKPNLMGLRPTAFTLVELLVVISIMSMLMSILLPSLSRAKEAGQRAHCFYNLRGLTVAWNVYAADNDGKLCSPRTWWNDYPGSPYWVADGPKWQGTGPGTTGNTEKAIKDGVLWPYTQSLGLYKCKSDRSGRLRSYSISQLMGEHERITMTCTGYDGITDHYVYFPFMILMQISRSADRMVFIDAQSDGRWLAHGFHGCCGLYKPRLFGGYNWNHITARHNGGCNLSFADMHCEYWKYKDKRTVELANRTLSGDVDPVSDNPDAQRMYELFKSRNEMPFVK